MDNDNKAGVETAETAETAAKTRAEKTGKAKPAAPAAAPAAATGKAARPKPPKVRLSKTAVLALLLVLALGGAGGWAYWQQLAINRQLQLQSAQLDTTPLQQQLQQTRAELQQANEKLAALALQQQNRAAEIATLRRQIAQNLQADQSLETRLQELSHADRTDWQLAEIEYLLRLAHQRVAAANNPAPGLELLLAADELLRELNRADLFAVREQLAADVLALQSVGGIDVEGIYLALSALAQSVTDLSFGAALTPQTAAPAADTKAANKLQQLWQDVLSLYRLRKINKPPPPMLSEEQQWRLQQRLLLLVEQARQALLSGSQTLYETSLAEASELLTAAALPTPAATGFIGQLNDLRQQQISVAMPDISGSHAKMADYLRNRRLHSLAPPAQPE